MNEETVIVLSKLRDIKKRTSDIEDNISDNIDKKLDKIIKLLEKILNKQQEG